LVNDITEVISNAMNIDMRSISIESHNGIFLGTITLEVKIKATRRNTKTIERCF
jgi:GTP pyrophosphokinase